MPPLDKLLGQRIEIGPFFLLTPGDLGVLAVVPYFFLLLFNTPIMSRFGT
jgi:hypothetical protein